MKILEKTTKYAKTLLGKSLFLASLIICLAGFDAGDRQAENFSTMAGPQLSPEFLPQSMSEVEFASGLASGRAVLIEDINGRQLQTEHGGETFHPASAIKLATAYAALRRFGPDFVFVTTLSTDGTLTPGTGVLQGNLYVAGNDPSFHGENAVLLAEELNRLGIRSVSGNIFVTADFTFQSAANSFAAAVALRRALNKKTRDCLAQAAFRESQGREPSSSVVINGAVGIGTMPPGAVSVLNHKSPPLKAILKALLCYSDNFMAENLGAVLGGPGAVQRSLTVDPGIAASEIQMQSTSGLGRVYITPRAMMLVLRSLHQLLAAAGLTLCDIMPVAAVDQGTLSRRFAEAGRRGSVVAKTGTLGHDFGGVSALVGMANTAQGPLFFVIFDRQGNVSGFRKRQDRLIKAIQDRLGGARALAYRRLKLALAMRPRCGR